MTDPIGFGDVLPIAAAKRIVGWLLVLCLVACGRSDPMKKDNEDNARSGSLARLQANALDDGLGGASLQACVVELEKADASRAVDRDIARAEKRFYNEYGWEKASIIAPGIRNCDLTAGRTPRFDKINRFDRADYAVGGPLWECQGALHNYRLRYNRAMAKHLGPGLGGNCPTGQGKIDWSQQPFDFAAYRRRQAGQNR